MPAWRFVGVSRALRFRASKLFLSLRVTMSSSMDPLSMVAEHTLVQAAAAIEGQLDSEIHALDTLDASGLEAVRKQRLAQLKNVAERKAQWLKAGHGEYTEVFSDKEFFDQTGGSERVICHFYRESLPCQVMHKHLRALAEKHLETKFLKMHAEKSTFVVERLRIWMLPTIAIIKDGKTVDYVVGLDELSRTHDFSTSVLADRLASSGVLFSDGIRPPRQTQTLTTSHGVQHIDEDSDFD